MHRTVNLTDLPASLLDRAKQLGRVCGDRLEISVANYSRLFKREPQKPDDISQPFTHVRLRNEVEFALLETICAECEQYREARCIACKVCGGKGRELKEFARLSLNKCPQGKWK